MKHLPSLAMVLLILAHFYKIH